MPASRPTMRSSPATGSSSTASRGAWRPGISGRISRSTAPTCTACWSRRCASASAADALILDHRCVGVEQDEAGVTARFADADGGPREAARGDVLIAATASIRWCGRSSIRTKARSVIAAPTCGAASRAFSRISPGPASPGSARAIPPSSSIRSATTSTRPATSWSTGCSSSSARSRCRSTGASPGGWRTSTPCSRTGASTGSTWRR